MKNVKLNFLLIFLLTFGPSYQGYADCPRFVESNTWWEAIVGGNWVKEIKVKAIKDQGVDSYFNPKIRVCAYDGKSYCYDLQGGTSCRQIYGTQGTGAGVSAAVFIDWEGDKTKAGGEIAQGLEWEWADGVTDEEKIKFANSPKICACSQKGACMSGISSWSSRVFSGKNIFRPGEMEKVCDTCYQKKVKCAPVPLAPSPPPFCEQLAMSLPQVRIVPITDKDNDYFNPKVKVIAGDLIEEDGKIGKELDFPKGYGENKAEWRSILDKDGITYYFKTYREKDKLCAKYHGTQGIDEKSLQFIRCFPAPPAPEPEIVKVANENTLEIKMKMSESACTYEARGTYSNGSCTFNVTNHPVNIGPLSLKVVKPRIVERTTSTSDNKSNINDIIENIFKNSSRFTILEQHGYVPNIGIELPNGDSCSLTNPREHNQCELTKLELDNMGQPKIEVGYMGVKNQVNSNSKMLCLSGWQPEPEEFVLEREGKVVPLKSMGTKYIEYNSVYSKESNQFYYLPSKEIGDLLKRPQNQLDKIIFNKQGYVFFPDDNKQEKGKCSYCVKRNDEIDNAFKSSKGLKVVYKLTDVEHREKCNQGDDGCICFNGTCSRSTRYVDKENTQSFYTKISQDANGVVTQQEAPIKANRTEVFYADKLCRFDLEGLKKKLKEIIKEQLKNKKQEPEKKSEKSHVFGSGNHDVDGSQITSSHVEIEVWGCGEAGHIKDTPDRCKYYVDSATKKNACSTETRAGMPGDYIKAKLEIDPDYPIIEVKVSEGGGNQESRYTDKDGGPIFVRKCSVGKQECKDLITMGGGGIYKMYPDRDNYTNYTDYTETIIDDSVKLKEKITTTGLRVTEDNRIAYIENGEIKYETVKCSKGFRSSKPGAGGCIDKGIYGKGSAGQVKVTPIIKGFDINIINDAIEKMIGNRYDPGEVRDFSRSEFDTSLTKMIEEELKKELLR
ncbi:MULTISPECIES: hypothetical protein [Wolbachia]|uniref:Uncharacterized protein n=1 Tax=Wolbachia pipientis TaxID=955 RepID=A0A7G5CBT9_WOLPI|nr:MULTISPECIES: hypothetical protein [Wolbachia]MDE5061569.1 hypothetical protein [Wolbachia endosymbiont of Drosophila nikananu]QMV46673.1 hypothetical protein HC356_00635 [Wolbachia pipientis]